MALYSIESFLSTHCPRPVLKDIGDVTAWPYLTPISRCWVAHFCVYLGVRFAWISLGYTALFLAVLFAFNRIVLVKLGAATPRCNISRAMMTLPVAGPAVGLLIAGDLLRFVALIPSDFLFCTAP